MESSSTDSFVIGPHRICCDDENRPGHIQYRPYRKLVVSPVEPSGAGRIKDTIPHSRHGLATWSLQVSKSACKLQEGCVKVEPGKTNLPDETQLRYICSPVLHSLDTNIRAAAKPQVAAKNRGRRNFATALTYTPKTC